MNASDILTAVNAGEDKDWEFKSAKGGMPGSLWETYSAMANTDGGMIVLGVKERDDDFEVQGLEDPDRIQQDFWNTINNRGKASVNLLANSDVRIVPVDGKPVLVIDVPRASRRQRPVFVGQNPLEGTFRRYHEGDYKCNDGETRPGGSSHNSGDSSHKGDSLHKRTGDSSHKLEEIPEDELKKLRVIAAPAYVGMRLPVEETRRTILQLCEGRFFTTADLAELMNRNPSGLRSRYLTPLVEEGLLERKYPAEPNRPDQAYRTKPDWKAQ